MSGEAGRIALVVADAVRDRYCREIADFLARQAVDLLVPLIFGEERRRCDADGIDPTSVLALPLPADGEVRTAVRCVNREAFRAFVAGRRR